MDKKQTDAWSYKHLMQELRLGDKSGNSNFLKMDPESFGLLESLFASIVHGADIINRLAHC